MNPTGTHINDRPGRERQGAADDVYTALVPVFDHDMGAWTVRLALSLARARKGRVVLVGMVRVPQDQSLSTGTGEAQERRATLEQLRRRFAGRPVLVKPRIRVAHEPWRNLVQLARQESASMVVVPWQEEGARATYGTGIDNLISYLDCNVVVATGDVPEQVNRILLPVRGSMELPLTLEVAVSLATANEALLTMMYARRDDAGPASRRIYEELVRMSQGNLLFDREIQVDEVVTMAVPEQAGQHDLVVVGAAEPGSGETIRTVGSTVRHLRRKKVGPLLIVKSHQPAPLTRLAEWGNGAPLPPTPTSVVVDKWFAENTFSSEEFEEIERLVALKWKQGLTISLGLPTLNEEATVGKVITTVRKRLVEEFPLLDEIVLIDSGSTDYTVEIARELGIPVYQHSEILPEYLSFRGKGEALWKSLYALQGDLIAWIDTDIVNIHPRFVYGVLGPLLQRDTIQYVKGFYRRPLQVGESLQAGGGGRVTELVARPLINLFYPELSGIVQPLSGEYAGRRSALESVPFYTGYGVEIGLLLDLVERYGVSGIAQVDLRRRVHHNQPLGALSQMSFAILQVFIDHLEKRQRVDLLREMNRTMKIIRYEPERYSLEELSISDKPRPPMITLPEYCERHGREVAKTATGERQEEH
jgi:hypothetical protein